MRLLHAPRAALAWLRTRDQGLAATRRACRAAVVMPAMFFLSDKVIGDPTVATFTAFGSFSMLLLVDFGGPMAERLQAQAALAVTGALLICLGTLCSRSTWLSVLSMGVIAFALLFAGVVSSVLAGSSTALLLAFILSVSLPGSVSEIPARVEGWALSAAAALLAIALLWPAPRRDPLRRAAGAACRALAARLRADVAYVLDGASGSATADREAAASQADAAVRSLRRAFFSTPYRPTGLNTTARAIVRLVDELSWLNTMIIGSAPKSHGVVHHRSACTVRAAAATVLERGGELLATTRGRPQPLLTALEDLERERRELERGESVMLPSGSVRPLQRTDGREDRIADFVSSLDPSFRAQELSFAVSQIGANVELAAAAERRSWFERLLGRQPGGIPGTFSAAQQRPGAHVERHSVWLHNSVRGAVALALAVLVAKETNVQHSFWVVFGTLSVLRSNALTTGENILRGLAGTVVGFVVGAALVSLIGTNSNVLWLLLPLAVLFAGLAPAAISFAAGQAAFTLTLLILFNLIAPVGWRIGITRIEDVVIGSAVSLVVGLLFWPRGASAALGRALAAAYRDGVTYLVSAVEFGLGCCDSGVPSRPEPVAEATRAAAASGRLDDAFREYLAERGEKPIPMAEVTELLTGATGLRLAADAILDFWERGDADGGDRGAARTALFTGASHVADWYSSFADSLTGLAAVPEPLVGDGATDGQLLAAVVNDLRREDGAASGTAARVIWTGDHLDAARRMQETLVAPARAVNALRMPNAA